MIVQIRGTLVAKTPTGVVIDCNGIGYYLFAPLSTIDQLGDTGSEVRLYTHFVVREDAMELYGFLSEEERRVFRLLIGISGIGPKLALGILSAISPGELKSAVDNANVALLQKLPGIGKKTAERLVVELRDKLRDIQPAISEDGVALQARREAVEALIALGYSKTIAEKAVKAASAELLDRSPSVEELIRTALRNAMSYR